MKHILLLLTAMLFCCCSSDSEVKAEVPANLGKTLIVYYSYTGNCEEIVSTLADQIQADIVDIQPSEKGLKYEANNYALGSQLLNAIKANPNDANSYPAIDPVTTSLDDYKNIIIVTPLWWSQMSAIMQSFLFQSASLMAGKHVGMIVSSHSSSISGVVNDAKRLLPNVLWMGDALWINASNHNNRATLIGNWLKTLNFDKENAIMDKMYITIDGQTQGVTLEDNKATQELVAVLKNAPITVTLNDNNFEIWGSLGRNLSTEDEQVNAQPGDVVLYSGQYICIFYGSNPYSYTRLGRIEGLSESELRTFLKAGESNIRATLSLTSGSTDIQKINNQKKQEESFYSMNGVKVKNPSQGLFIKNNKKIVL